MAAAAFRSRRDVFPGAAEGRSAARGRTPDGGGGSLRRSRSLSRFPPPSPSPEDAPTPSSRFVTKVRGGGAASDGFPEISLDDLADEFFRARVESEDDDDEEILPRREEGDSRGRLRFPAAPAEKGGRRGSTARYARETASSRQRERERSVSRPPPERRAAAAAENGAVAAATRRQRYASVDRRDSVGRQRYASVDRRGSVDRQRWCDSDVSPGKHLMFESIVEAKRALLDFASEPIYCLNLPLRPRLLVWCLTGSEGKFPAHPIIPKYPREPIYFERFSGDYTGPSRKFPSQTRQSDPFLTHDPLLAFLPGKKQRRSDKD